MILHLSEHSPELRTWSHLFLFPAQLLYVFWWLFYLKYKTKPVKGTVIRMISAVPSMISWRVVLLSVLHGLWPCHFCDSPFFTIHCKVHERWQPPWRTRAIASEKKIIIITKNNNLEASQLDLVTWERVEHVLTPNSHTHLVSLNHKWLVEKIREGVGLEKGLQLACLDRQRKVTWERHPVLIERLDRNPEIPVW